MSKVFKTCRIVAKINRSSLIPYHQKKQNIDFKTNILFVSPFDKAFSESNKIIVTSFKNATVDQLKELKIKPVNSIQSNVGSLLIHNRKLELSKRYFSKPCNKSNCRVCKYIANFSFVRLNNNFIVPLKCYGDCLSTHIVYIIICNRCKAFYIGESSKTVKERISQHLNDISRFKKNLDISLGNFDSCSPLATHFSDLNHDIDKDFNFVIFNKDFKEDLIRKSVESDLINIFLSLGQKLLNKFIPNKLTVSNFSFK